MADLTHLEVLSKGVEAWNSWRRDNRIAAPNLDGLQISWVFGTRNDGFSWYALESIDLSGTSLIGSDFGDADLSNACFDRADLTDASFRCATLDKASFRNACLIRTDLTLAEINNADLANATLGDTLLLRMDLSQVRGLSDAQHRFTSMIDVATLENTRKGLKSYPLRYPEVLNFFRSCGVAKPYLELFGSLASPVKQ